MTAPTDAALWALECRLVARVQASRCETGYPPGWATAALVRQDVDLVLAELAAIRQLRRELRQQSRQRALARPQLRLVRGGKS